MQVWYFTVGTSYRLKRFFDIVLSLAALAALSPFLLAVAVWVKLDSSGPVIYRQVRVGRFGRHFRFYKFRTMRVDADRIKQRLMAENQSADGVIFKMKRDPRVTRIGRYLRKFSIDELPQLFNVLIGDMSLVGPRPPLPDEVRLYTLEDRKRLNSPASGRSRAAATFRFRSRSSLTRSISLRAVSGRTAGFWSKRFRRF